MCLPEILTVDEAVFIANQEYQLSEEHQALLRDLLRAMIEVRDMVPDDPIRRFAKRIDGDPRIRHLLLQAIKASGGGRGSQE